MPHRTASCSMLAMHNSWALWRFRILLLSIRMWDVLSSARWCWLFDFSVNVYEDRGKQSCTGARRTCHDLLDF